MTVRIYTTPTCGYCQMAKRFLAEHGVSYEEIDVSRDPVAAEEMGRLTGQMGVPVIVVDGEVVLGFDRARLEYLLARGDDHHPRLGLKVADASRMAARSGEAPVFGALVGVVVPSSPGERAGLQVGDIIIEVNQRRISNAEELGRVLSELTAGNRVTLVFLRDNQKRKSEVKV